MAKEQLVTGNCPQMSNGNPPPLPWSKGTISILKSYFPKAILRTGHEGSPPTSIHLQKGSLIGTLHIGKLLWRNHQWDYIWDHRSRLWNFLGLLLPSRSTWPHISQHHLSGLRRLVHAQGQGRGEVCFPRGGLKGTGDMASASLKQGSFPIPPPPHPSFSRTLDEESPSQ